MKMQFRALFIIVFIFTSLNVSAKEKFMYKWNDDKGEIHYTERAPKGIEYTRIRILVDSTATASNKLPIATSSPESQEKKKSSYGTWRDENCTAAKQNLDILKNAARISVDDGQGGKQLMSDEQKQEKIAQMEEQKTKYCNVEEDKK